MTHDLLGQVGGYGGPNPFDDFPDDDTQQELQTKMNSKSTSETKQTSENPFGKTTDDIEMQGNPFDSLFEDNDDPSAYMDIYDTLKQHIADIEANKNEVLKLNSRLVSATTGEEIKKLNKRLDDIMGENYKLSKAVTNQLKIEKENNEKFASQKNKQGSSVAQWRKNQLNSCAKNFQEISREFTDALNVFQETMNDQTKRQINIVKTQEMTDEDVDRLVENPQAAQKFVQQSLQMEDMNDEMLNHLVDLEDKLQGMEKIVQSLEELQQMWTELNMLISEQQELLDNIEVNVEATGNYITQAKKHLVKAEKHQKCTRKLQLCLCCILVCVLLAIIIPVASTQGGSS